jgi:hypothetical protein
MAVEIATAYFSLLPSMAGTAAAVRTGLGSAAVTSSFASAGATSGTAMGGGVVAGLGKAAGPIAVALAALGVADFLGNAIDKASDLNESANAVRVTFGDAADEVARLGETAATQLGLSNTDFNALAVRFSSFATTVAGDSRGVADVLDELTIRAADFASVMNIDVADAASLFQSGLAGESEPLRKYGIDISAATVATTAYRLGIAEAGAEMTEQQKVQARYAAIMEQTSKVQGDFANTSDELANTQRINQARFDDAAAAIGEALLPAATKFAEFAADKLIPLLEKVGPIFEKLEPAIDVFIDALLFITEINFITPLDSLLNLIAALEDGEITADEAAAHFASLPGALQDMIGGYYTFINGLLAGVVDFANGILDAVERPINAIRELLGMSKLNFDIKTPQFANPAKTATKGLAAGGVLDTSGVVRVGEYGPEMLYLPENAEVHPLPAAGATGGDLRPLLLRLIEATERGHALYADGSRLAESAQAGATRLSNLGTS